jgi:PHD/YefM family antitoxin component YafN of YafNO toxin-antitoxin module
MIWFATDELISSTKLVRNFSSVLDSFKNKGVSKIWILKNNNVEAVIISVELYNLFEELEKYKENLEKNNVAKK